MLARQGLVALYLIVFAGTAAIAEDETTLVFDGPAAIGSWVATTSSLPLCPTPEEGRRIFSMTTNELAQGLPAGCVRARQGTEVQIVKVEAAKDPFVCVRQREQSDCLWADPMGLESKAAWSHDRRNHNSAERAEVNKKTEISCQKIVSALDRNPDVKRYEPFDPLSPVYSHRFDDEYLPNISISCGADLVDMTVSLESPRPTQRFISFFGAIAHDVTGVDQLNSAAAALRCYNNAVSQRKESERVDTPALHVDCRVSGNFISFGVYQPGPEGEQ